MSNSVTFFVGYPNVTKSGEPARFDLNYYLNVHMPLIDKFWKPYGLKSWTVEALNADDSVFGQEPPYSIQAVLIWDRVEDLKKALAEGSKETLADIPNYTNIHPDMWVAKVIEKRDG